MSVFAQDGQVVNSGQTNIGGNIMTGGKIIMQLQDEVVKLQNENQQLKTHISTLMEDVNFLEALRQAGVDNWDGYSYAWDIMEEWELEE